MDNLINVTDITAWLYCPRKVWIKKTKGLREPPNKKMMLGKYIHEIFDLFNKNELAFMSNFSTRIEESQILEKYNEKMMQIIKEIFLYNNSNFKKFEISFKEFSDQANIMYKNDLLLRAKAVKSAIDKGFLGNDIFPNINPRYLTEFSISSQKLGIKGRIDRIRIDKEKSEIMPYELKNRKEVFESDFLQLAAYALLLESEFSLPVEKGMIEIEGQEQEVALVPEMKEKVIEIAGEIKNLSQAPPFNSNFSKCQSCIFQKECFGE